MTCFVINLHHKLYILSFELKRESWVNDVEFVVVEHYNNDSIVCHGLLLLLMVVNIFLLGDIDSDGVGIKD